MTAVGVSVGACPSSGVVQGRVDDTVADAAGAQRAMKGGCSGGGALAPAEQRGTAAELLLLVRSLGRAASNDAYGVQY